MVASSHPSHQEQETKGEATSYSRVGRSRRAGGYTAAAAGLAASQCQCSAGTAVTSPPVVAAEATLVVACQLLNKPPPPQASPSVAEQWRHDVDQLIIAAINTPPHGGLQPPLVVHSCMLTVAHAPSVARVSLAVHARQPRCMYQWQAWLQLTSGPNSTAVVMVKIATSPLSVSVRGTTTLRVIPSRGSSTLSRRHKKCLQHAPQPA
jgi:hypothetical protein